MKLNKTNSSIYRELKNNSIVKEGKKTCAHCGKCGTCERIKYFKSCPKFVFTKCEKLEKFPYVCNACPTKQFCTNTKIYYNCEIANENQSN